MKVKSVTTQRFFTFLLVMIASIAIIVAMLYVLNLSVPSSVTPQTAPLNDQSGETNSTPTNPTVNQPAEIARRVNIAYTADGDDGKIGEKVGCGDSVVLVSKTVQAAGGSEEALRILLADKSEKYGTTGLRNALWQSSLTLGEVTITGKTATVKLSGSLQLSGVCDIPRVKAQLESTIKASSDVSTVSVTVNDKTLDEALSLK